ncbi:scarecrow-like protein 6 [Hordeum vulgare]|nr:scarecrow-like protein 6 [Hordeum vulgare]
MPTQQLTTFQLLPPAHAHADRYHHHHQQQVACGGGGGGGHWDPASVLDRRASPAAHPTLSSSPLPAGVAALAKNVSAAPPAQAQAQAWPPPGPGADDDAKDDWVHQLPPLDMAGWGDPHAAAMHQPHPTPSSQDTTFLRWIIGGGDDDDNDSGPAMDGDPPDLDLDRITMLPRHHHHHNPPPLLMGGTGHGLPFTLAAEDTKQPFRPSPGAALHQQQHHFSPHTHGGAFPSFDAAEPAKRHPMGGAGPPKLPPFGSGQGAAAALKPKAEAASDDGAAAAAMDHLTEAARLVEAGDAFGAREILARLNHRLPAAPAAGTPLLRSAFYFKEALSVALDATGAHASSASVASTPVDVLLKLGAYKAFSELSPVLQFAHFTCVQAVLDELGGAGCIHVLDFDIGVGEQWASLMQELAQRRPGAALKVTALVLPSTHHPLELQLIHENLANFAAELGVPFQFVVFNLDSVDPTELLAIAGGDAIAVHLPVGSVHAAAVPSVLHLVRRLGAKLVISVDRSGDHGELPFAAHLIQAFKSCVFLLESLDAVGTDSDVASKIERFLIQPKVESCVVRRHRAATAGDKLLPWRTMFTSAGFVPVQVSNFAEAQADSLLKKVPVRGFRVERRAGSLVLHWQRAELVSVSAWRC